MEFQMIDSKVARRSNPTFSPLCPLGRMQRIVCLM
jgi:hypothetical protein